MAVLRRKIKQGKKVQIGNEAEVLTGWSGRRSLKLRHLCKFWNNVREQATQNFRKRVFLTKGTASAKILGMVEE